MDISEIRVKLIPNPSDRLKAFCSVTLDGDFVIRDIKIIDGTSGTFVAMPSRKLADRCPNCGGKNHLRARFCNDCGEELDRDRAARDELGRTKLHADIAHPINTECRQTMQERIVAAFREELERADQPGYEPTDLDDDGSVFDGDDYADESYEQQRDDSVEVDDQEDMDHEGETDDDYGTDDYNELIEDLKRTSGERRPRSRSGSQGDRSRDRGGNNRSRGRDGGRQDDRKDDRKGDRKRSSDRREQRGGKKEGGRSGDRRQHKHRDVAKPVVREQAPPSPPPVAPPPPPPPVVDEDDDFGAGIL